MINYYTGTEIKDMETKKKILQFCTYNLYDEKPLLLGKPCKNEYLTISLEFSSSKVFSGKKCYYEYYENINNYRVGLKYKQKKMKQYEIESVTKYIDTVLYDLIMNQNYRPIILKLSRGVFDVPYLTIEEVIKS